MKVIIIKDCKDGKVNQIIDVSDGYAKNYLIKNKFAIPVNKKTSLFLDKKLENEKNEELKKIAEANELREKIHKIILHFKLKETNNVVHGSITAKKILKALEELHIKLPKHSLEDHVHIVSLGLTVLNVKLHKDVIAHLRVKVEKDE
ncbi:50S ribosomal protein L9 [Mesomycoplasma lagogenitalium]|uniref:Large ribosomal subunit protein bL9 n=1 Tax=Mesomycoplasma lagogenitalium TaxID=171286 RepID=A0ABY8LU92_9BACT|nr:50S ribosomal protein L9 [Mesomycoplasma lagogenitalium]WGI36802.1 50S ribosomal protein L9 [Mesomycoplasma lagogenitalium]